MVMRRPSAWRAEGPLTRLRKLFRECLGRGRVRPCALDHCPLMLRTPLTAPVPRADCVGGGRLGLGIGGWPRMDARGAWWPVGTGSSGRFDLFSAIRGAQRLTAARNLIQTTLGLVLVDPQIFSDHLWFYCHFACLLTDRYIF